jgi:BRK domain
MEETTVHRTERKSSQTRKRKRQNDDVGVNNKTTPPRKKKEEEKTQTKAKEALKAKEAPPSLPAICAPVSVSVGFPLRPSNGDAKHGERRVALWNKKHGYKISGFTAPKAKNLEKYLAQHKDCKFLNVVFLVSLRH